MSTPTDPGKTASKRPAATTNAIPFAAETVQSPMPSIASAGAPVDSAVSEVRAGSRIGKYQIVKLLGRGGMGAVYEAIDVALHRKVALKILPREFSENDEALKRFIREARLAARL